MTPRRVLLVGMMGSGKTTVGRLLADQLGWRYLDSDEEVEARTGRTVRELFEAGGEEAFRPLESEALAAAVQGDAPSVVSVAGGAVLDPDNRSLLRRSGAVVWLRARPSTLARRVSGSGSAPPARESATSATSATSARRASTRPDHRPLLEHDPVGTITRLDRERRPIYEEVADVVVDVDEIDPPAVVDAVVAALGGVATPSAVTHASPPSPPPHVSRAASSPRVAKRGSTR